MRKVIKRAVCDTATAKPLASAGGVTLYMSRAGKLFVSDNRIRIELLDADSAEEWLESNATGRCLEELIDVSGGHCISAKLTPRSYCKLRKLAFDRGASITDVIEELIEKA